ncbi:hypothetical protein L3V83_03845 [Thiotrichales bacterium 19X7-9]|nr:hypothetical protein [Thiotrichales bacterium 19X7-9]
MKREKKTFKFKVVINLLILLFVLNLPLNSYASDTSNNHYFDNLKQMFSQMVEAKKIDLMSNFYHKDFILYSNGTTMDYDDFYNAHKKIYQTNVGYKIDYDTNTIVEQENKVACRLFITVTKPKQPPQKIEVILVAEYKNNKIYRLWELTYPNWRKSKTFKNVK